MHVTMPLRVYHSDSTMHAEQQKKNINTTYEIIKLNDPCELNIISDFS